jgi:tRNA1(Val) A37 N6-methylase TrmN6
MSVAEEASAGHLLGGRLVYAQPRHGFRSGIEPVLLAASVPAAAGDRVLEAGTGAGAAVLCLSARVAGVRTVGVEVDGAQAELAAANVAANGFADSLIVTGDIETVALTGGFDHAMANPPYHLGGGTESPVAARGTAKRGSEALIRGWVRRLGLALRDRGSLTLVVPSGVVPPCLSAMSEVRTPCSAVFPLWPKAGRPAKLVLLRGIRLGRGGLRLMPGLVLHQADGSFTDGARAVLRDGAPLEIDG